jgi:hypothetical protein
MIKVGVFCVLGSLAEFRQINKKISKVSVPTKCNPYSTLLHSSLPHFQLHHHTWYRAWKFVMLKKKFRATYLLMVPVSSVAMLQCMYAMQCCLSVWRNAVCMSVCMYVCMSVYLSCLSVCLSLCLSVCLSVCQIIPSPFLYKCWNSFQDF